MVNPILTERSILLTLCQIGRVNDFKRKNLRRSTEQLIYVYTSFVNSIKGFDSTESHGTCKQSLNEQTNTWLTLQLDESDAGHTDLKSSRI